MESDSGRRIMANPGEIAASRASKIMLHLIGAACIISGICFFIVLMGQCLTNRIRFPWLTPLPVSPHTDAATGSYLTLT